MALSCANRLAPRILVVDDESFIREAIELYLQSEGYQVDSAAGGEDALRLMANCSFDVAILDIMMPGIDGITLLGEIKKRCPDVEVVMASGYGALDSAIEAIRMGAYDYIAKPILNFEEDLLRVVRRAHERSRLRNLNRQLTAELETTNCELRLRNQALERQLAGFERLAIGSTLLANAGNLDDALSRGAQCALDVLSARHALLLLAGADRVRIASVPSSVGRDERSGPAAAEIMSRLPAVGTGPSLLSSHPRLSVELAREWGAAYNEDGLVFELTLPKECGIGFVLLGGSDSSNSTVRDGRPLVDCLAAQISLAIQHAATREANTTRRSE
ncbi:MAG: sigma-54-dependent transcriptional regulator [Planctomycetota bacterium]